jgi:hypothetical protein
VNNSTTAIAGEKISTDLKSLELKKKQMVQVSVNIKTIIFYLINLATDFLLQQPYLLD